ncbi:MAG: methyltransferase [Calditrichia bacterium]
MFRSRRFKNSENLDHFASPPYEQLAVIYDKIMDHVEYEKWANYIKKIIQAHHELPVTVLDIGCGTGRFIAELTKLKIPAEGCDPSAAMLKVAAQRLPDTQFRIDSLPELKHIEPGRYPVMTCLYDSINYLNSLEEITRSLDRVYELLPDNGLFIFDAVSRIFCQHYFDGFNEQDVINKKIAYVRSSFYDFKNQQQINEFKIYTPEGIFEEKHVQTIFSFRDIKAIIREMTNFRLIGVFEDFTFFDAEEDSNRAHFILQK